MIDFAPCENNVESNTSSDTNYSNSNTILSEMSEIQPIIEIESYANVLRRPTKTAKKAKCLLRTTDSHHHHQSSRKMIRR